jgi:hypothetical protein
MKYLEYTQERDASATAKFVKAEVPAKVSSTLLEENPALPVTKVVAYYHSLHRNLRLDFTDGKPKFEVEHLVSVIKPAILKALIESKLEIGKQEELFRVRCLWGRRWLSYRASTVM